MVVLGQNEKAKESIIAASKAFAFLGGDYETIVVDNGRGGDEAFAFDVNNYKVKIVRSGGNVGFARGANIGAKEAKGDFFLFLNPDTSFPDEGSLQRLFAAAAKLPDEGAFAPRLRFEDGKAAPWGGYFHYRVNRLLGHLNPAWALPALPEKGLLEVDWVAATAMLVSRSSFVAVDGFAEEYYMFFEDVDICHRFQERNMKSFLVVDAEIVHQGGGTYRLSPQERKAADYRMSRVTFFKKYAPIRGWLAGLLDLLPWGRYNRPQ